MTPMQQMLLGIGAKKKTYLDDVFSTYLYTGTGSAKSINNGINLSGEGGMTWIKGRSVGTSHILNDTVRGAGNRIFSNSYSSSESSTAFLSSFNSNGFSIGDDNDVSYNGQTFASWSFRKTKGFFDVVSWTGNGSNRTIAHSLGCVPGCIMIKNTSSNENWRVYHRSIGAEKHVILNLDNASADSATQFNDTEPTASVFSVGTDDAVNKNGDGFIAYVFAGGNSPAATAKTLQFDNDVDALEIASHSDFGTGTGAFTWEAWIKPASWGTYGALWCVTDDGTGTDGGLLIAKEGGFKVKAAGGTNYLGLESPPIGVWTHFAVCRSGSTIKAFYNGIEQKSATCSANFPDGKCYIGYQGSNTGGSGHYNGLISNVRWIKGTALYTSSFAPPTEPLTNVTNTKLLCCNSSSATGSTVTPSTISAKSGSDVTTSIDTPFDDPAAYIFGENGDQSIIKCGISKAGSSGAITTTEIGWEPQWLIQKQVNAGGSWFINDSMLGWGHSGFDYLRANNANTEANQSGSNGGYPISQGFDFPGNWWSDTNEFVWIAIRRPDGYVGKPASAGTEVFAMDTGNGSATIPAFDSGFPVDFNFQKEPAASSDHWYASARLLGDTNYLVLNLKQAEASWNDILWDSNVGVHKNMTSSTQGWMFKRHAGFDVVTTQPGTGTGMVIKHSLGRTPEMIWTKKRDTSNWGQNSSNSYVLDNWFVWHKDDHAENAVGYLGSNVDGGLSTVYSGTVNSLTAQFHSDVTYSGDENLMLFFASVDGISKCGTFTGTDSNPGPTVTTGFQPRFIMIKGKNLTSNWLIVDSLRGISNSGNDYYNWLNLQNAQENSLDIVDISSTGFTLKAAYSDTNVGQYVYYAHA